MDGGSCSRGRARLVGSVLAVLLLLAAAAGDATAAGQPPPEPPPDASAVDAYRESVPTSAGTHVVGSRVRRVVPLPPAIEARVRGDAGKSAAVLERVATSSDLGAPLVRSHHTAAARDVAAAEPPGGWAPRGAVGAVVDELAGGVGLLGVFAVAAAAGALLLRRRRSDA